MRFSLKALLITTSFVAISAAAVSMDPLWSIVFWELLAFALAIYVTRGRSHE